MIQSSPTRGCVLIVGTEEDRPCITTQYSGQLCSVGAGVRGGGAHWALEHWYVTLRPKWVISEPNGLKIIQFETKSDHSSSKNVSKIFVLYLRDFL